MTAALCIMCLITGACIGYLFCALFSANGK